jgi:hypothetical protein
MVCYASPSSAPSAYPHVRYTSHHQSKDINNFTGAHSEVGDHSEAGITNLEARMTGLKTERKDFKRKSYTIDILGIKFKSS